ncbi:MAG: hypothetical protein AAF518_12440 [Spirochaetota bacterium]
MQNKKIYDEIFKEVLKEILREHHLEIEYEIPGNPKRIDFYLEEKDKPINSTMVYLKIFAKHNLMEFKSEGDIFQYEDLVKTYCYISNFLVRNLDTKGQLHFILFCSIKPKLLFRECKVTQVKQGIYQTLDIQLAPVYVVVISELPTEEQGEVEQIRLFQEKKQLDNYLQESIQKKRDLRFALVLYRKRLKEIAKRLGVDMTAIEERIIEMGREVGLVHIAEADKRVAHERRLNRKNKLQMALKMKRKGCELTFISEITDIPEPRLKRFFRIIREL